MPKQARGKGVQIYIRDEDRAIIQAAAERDGRSLSNYIVMAAKRMATGEIGPLLTPYPTTYPNTVWCSSNGSDPDANVTP